MIIFKCKNEEESWSGKIKYLNDYGNYYEMRIESRSGLQVIFGESSAGGFACIPEFNVGCHLAHLNDRFWNTEKLTAILGEVDGITVAEALYELSDVINDK